MKKSILVLLAFIPCLVFAQSIQKGDIAFDVGMEIGLYKDKISYDITYQNYHSDTVYNDTTAAWFVPIHVEYYLTDKFAAGAIYKRGKYFDDNARRDNRVNVFAASAAYHFVDNGTLNLFSRLAAGYSTLYIEENNDDLEWQKWGGFHGELDLGMRVYIGDHFAFNWSFGYNIYNYRLKDINLDEDIYFDDIVGGWDLDVKGFEMGLGLVGKF